MTPCIREAALLHTVRPSESAAFAVVAALLATATPAGAAEPDAACLEGAVGTEALSVDDARTVRLTDDRLIRPAGLESFALLIGDEAAAEAALRDRLRALIAGKRLRLRTLSAAPDRYGRLPALLAPDGEPLLQATLAREGVGLAVAPADGGLPCFAEILSAEGEARRMRRGFWAEARILSARPGELATRIGRFTIFEGPVISVGNRRARTYLNFGSRWSSDVTVEIASRDRQAFGGEAALAALSGQRIRVRGFVEERGGPSVTVRSPLQLEILGPARNRP